MVWVKTFLRLVRFHLTAFSLGQCSADELLSRIEAACKKAAEEKKKVT
jgi:predicted O-linked N-acetylglucosamine transferase (SPINDLY family)